MQSFFYGTVIGNCLFFKKDDNTKTKENASLFRFFPGKEWSANRSRIILHPGIGVFCKCQEF